MSASFTLSTTVEDVERISKELSTCPYLFLDCEGDALGLRGGALSIIAIGTSDALSTYLFDVPKIGREGLSPILKLLMGDEKIKVIWDGRRQLRELHSDLGVTVSHFIDLQLVEAECVGQIRSTRPSRVKNYFGDQLVNEHPKLFKNIQCAIDLRECVKSQGLGDAGLVGETYEYVGWAQRPLPQRLLEYSAQSIRQLALVYNHFFPKDFLQQEDTRHFEWISQAHALPLPNDKRLESGDIFRTSPILPLELVDGRSLAGETCETCGRTLPLDCFDIEEIVEAPFGGTLDEDDESEGYAFSDLSDHKLMRRERCNPCRAIALKHGLSDGGYTVECSVTYSDEEGFDFEDLDVADWDDGPKHYGTSGSSI